MRRPALRVLVLLLTVVALAAAVPAIARQSTLHKQAQAKQQLAELRSRMEALAREQAQTAARRDSANAELARQANALADADAMVPWVLLTAMSASSASVVADRIPTAARPCLTAKSPKSAVVTRKSSPDTALPSIP